MIPRAVSDNFNRLAKFVAFDRVNDVDRLNVVRSVFCRGCD